jgi:hypothetical protein
MKIQIPVTFDIYLLETGEHPLPAGAILDVLRSSPLRFHAAEPGQCVYRNADTSVFFQVQLSPAVVAILGGEPAIEAEEASSDEGDDQVEAPGSAEEETSDSEEEASDSEGDGQQRVEMALVTISVPYGTPAFFGREAVAFAERLAGATNLRLEHLPHGGDGASGQEAAARAHEHTLLDGWQRGNRLAARQASALSVWSREQSEAWWAYGTACKALDAELAAEGIHVPRLQAARHEGAVKSLCFWEEGTPAVFPRCDLFLVRRERQRKGILFTRRIAEEGLVSGEKLWSILAPFSELRESPAPLLIFREARKPPQQVAAALEVLPLEPVEAARRTELLGVVDADPSRSEEQP